MVVIDGWTYYQFDKVDSQSRCEEIATSCRRAGLLARIAAVACAILAAAALVFSYLCAAHVYHDSIAGLAFSLHVFGLASIPFVMLSVVVARLWSHYHHLETQAEKAISRSTLLRLE